METKKLRTCVIIQSELVNNQSKTLIVAPLLPNHKPWPFVVNLESTQKKNGLDKAGHISFKQLCAVDVSRIGKLQGRLGRQHLPAIENVLTIVFGTVKPIEYGAIEFPYEAIKVKFLLQAA